MRIALIAPPWLPVPPRSYGGTELVVDLLARGYRDAGHEVVLFTTGDATSPVARRSLYETARGLGAGSDVEARHAAWAYDEIASHGAFDIVHDHTAAGVREAARHPGLAVVATLHHPLEGQPLEDCRAVADRVHLVAVSDAQRRHVPELPVTRVVHHGVDPAAYPLGPGGDYCLFLGRLALDNGVSGAIAAARKAGLPLVIAGKVQSSTERAYFEERVKPHLGEGVRYVGEVGMAEKLELLGHARALLLPALWAKPFGLAMLEAFACGAPVLARPQGAVPEVVTDGVTGFFCRDDTAMAEAIGRVDTLRREDCRAAVEGYFSAQRMVLDYLTLFSVVASSAC
jgi:glycosyltransferase involved in cell wall biosynthesis